MSVFQYSKNFGRSFEYAKGRFVAALCICSVQVSSPSIGVSKKVTAPSGEPHNWLNYNCSLPLSAEAIRDVPI